MLPIDTRRREVRSASPPPRRSGIPVGGGYGDEVGEDDDTTLEQRALANTEYGTTTGAKGESESSEPEAPVRSVRSAVREVELLHDELSSLGARMKVARKKQALVKSELAEFMTTRNLAKIHTRDGRLNVRMSVRTSYPMPGKREVLRCVEEVLGDHPDLAAELRSRLVDQRAVQRTTTTVKKLAVV